MEDTDIDLSLLEYNLSLSYDQRAENHQRALDLFNELLKARKELYGELESSPEASMVDAKRTGNSKVQKGPILKKTTPVSGVSAR